MPGSDGKACANPSNVCTVCGGSVTASQRAPFRIQAPRSGSRHLQRRRPPAAARWHDDDDTRKRSDLRGKSLALEATWNLVESALHSPCSRIAAAMVVSLSILAACQPPSIETMVFRDVHPQPPISLPVPLSRHTGTSYIFLIPSGRTILGSLANRPFLLFS